MMKESDLLSYIYATSRPLPPAVSIGPGDDMGAVVIGGQRVLVTVDQVIDGLHFDLRATSVGKIGRKAVMRNLSDVAAMAAKPSGAVVAVALPNEFGQDQATSLFDVIRMELAGYGCPLIGGDIAIGRGPLVITVTVFAETAGVEPVLRKGAIPDDVIYVTGDLGGSMEEVDGRLHHLDFTPRLDLARSLASDTRLRPHCMIDVSDGLAKDLLNLGRASGVNMRIDSQRLPTSTACLAAADRSGLPAWQHAVGDGEDYELLFTASEGLIPGELVGVRITPIGMVLDRSDKPCACIRLPDDSIESLDEYGWEHGK